MAVLHRASRWERGHQLTGGCDGCEEIGPMNDKHPENSLHRLLMDAYSGWKATQPKGPLDIKGALTEVVGFIREMIRQIDPKHETERLEAVAFALAEVSDAMNNLISGHGEPRH